MTAQRATLNGGLTSLQRENAAATNTVSNDVIKILDCVEVPILVLRRNFVIACFNRTAADVLGLAPSDIGRESRDVFGLAALPRLEQQCRQVMNGGMELRADFRDGDKWFAVRISPYTQGERQVTGVVLTFTGANSFRASIDLRSEEELRRSETFLAESQRLSLTGSFSWKAATGEITWSEQLYRIYGLEVGTPVTLELIRKRVHPEDLSLLEKMAQEAGNGKNDFEWRYRLVMPDQSIKYMHAVTHARRHNDGQLEYIAAVQDVTQQHHDGAALQKAFDEIKKSEAKVRQVIDTIPTLAWCNLPDGPNEFLNKGWHEYTGLSPEKSHDWGWQAAFHPEDLPPLMEKWLAMLVSGEPGEIEARLRRHDGVYRWFLVRAEPFRDESGKIVRWYGTSTDIDDRKRAEEQLRRSEAFLAEGQHLARIGNFAWRVATDDIVWSEQLYRIFEFEPGAPVTLEVMGHRVHPEDQAMLNDMVGRARKGDSDFEYEHRLLMPDRSVKYLHLIAHRIRDSAGELEYIGAVQDVTQRRSSEEALAKARSELAQVARIMSLATLTASIAHEINQPLSGIVTNASTCLRMLGSDPPNIDGARETARRTIRDSNRASQVVTRLRALFSKKEATFEPVDLNEAAREVMTLCLSELQRNRVVLRSELPDDLPSVIGDRVQLQQVILNLLRNGTEAMRTVDDRPRELTISTGRETDSVRLTVKDAGVGFAPTVLDKLFEAFYTTKADGMGIGLSISRSIIELHHGRLWATPNNGPGATFCFSIPCSPPASADQAE
jgi:PAS domain S-box-containing protein